MLKLFNLQACFQNALIQNQFGIKTPLGNIFLEIFINGKPINNISLRMKGSLGQHASVYIWDSLAFHLELIKLSFIPKLPKDMKIDGCFAYLCKFKNLSEKISFRFNCYLETMLKGSVESGEYLLALRDC